MDTKKVLTRENKATDDLTGMAEKNFRGIKLEYPEVYYLDYDVNEQTGMINKNIRVKHYSKNQIERNLKALKMHILLQKEQLHQVRLLILELNIKFLHLH